jgi:CRISPR-associated protein Csd1
MLLQRLREYSQRLDLPPVGYDKTAVRWLINLNAEGKFLGFITTSSGRKNDRGREYLVPHVLVTSGIKAKLFVGNGEYVLGFARDPGKQARVRDCHQAFIQQVRDCAEALNSPRLNAVVKFLESLDLETLPLPDDFDPSMNLTFQVDGVLPVDLPEVQAYWAQVQGGDDPSASSGQCLVCGEACVPTDRHPFKLKIFPDVQGAGLALVSANAAAFLSYGLKASHIAPVCRDCAERYAKAANALKQKEDSNLRVGPLVYLFWTRQETGFNLAALFSQPQPEQVKELLRSAPKGRLYTALDSEAFYATALSASGGRVVVRDWLETTVGEVKEHLARWFRLQRLMDWDGSEGSPYGLYPLAASLVRDPRQDLPPNVPKVMLRVALQGGPLPAWLMFQAIKRNRAEQALTRPRAALIKMVLLSQLQNFQEDAMVRLDEENLHPAYLCGRLLAVLEQVQFVAVSPKATLIDRFYGTASTAPASVFSRLLKGAQAHLGKLRKEKPGAYVALQTRLEGIMGNLSGFPKVLTLEEQGWFSLGYYHQRAWDRAQAKARKATGEVIADLEDVTEEQE